VVLGGDGAISGQLGTQLDTLAPEVTYVAGQDRYETSWRLNGLFPGQRITAFFASGMNFPDALAGAPVVGLAGERVLLTAQSTLNQYVRWSLSSSRPDRLIILGGPGAVSSAIETELKTTALSD
jgi:putative cell wall-binding protein